MLRKLVTHTFRVALDDLIANGCLASSDVNARRGGDTDFLDVPRATAIQGLYSVS